LVDAVVKWYREHKELFERAETIVVEQQFVLSGTRGCFPPLVVMEALLTLATLEWPGKMKLINAASLKKHFGIRGTYEERKREVQRLAGLQHLGGRIHDIADAVLMIEYSKTRDQKVQEALVRNELRVKKRQRLRDGLSSPSASPPAAVITGRSCGICGESSSRRYVGANCIRCYNREHYRRTKKSKGF
jgi:hypothetical protein